MTGAAPSRRSQLFSVVSGFTEAAMLAVIAQIAVSLAGSGKVRLHGLHMHASTDTLILIAFGLAIAPPADSVPALGPACAYRRRRPDPDCAGASTTPSRVASWSVQSADREGQLQETMSGQVIQAGNGALQITSLITSSLTFLVMLGFAVRTERRSQPSQSSPTAIAMFGVLRPLRNVAVRRSRALSKAQVRYTASVAESNRLAEETQVFGVAAQQRERMDGYIDSARDLLYRAQLIGRLVPSLYQSLIYLFLVGALAFLHAAGKGHTASLGAVVLILIRAASNGQSVQAAYQGFSQSLPFIERTQNCRGAIPRRARRPTARSISRGSTRSSSSTCISPTGQANRR